MEVTNIGPKVLGFEKMILLPNESGKLPDGFDGNHPSIKFYIGRGWLKTAGPDKTEGPVEADKPEDPVEGPEKSIKSLERMTLIQLQEKAAELGIQFAPIDTKAILAEKIAAKLHE